MTLLGNDELGWSLSLSAADLRRTGFANYHVEYIAMKTCIFFLRILEDSYLQGGHWRDDVLQIKQVSDQNSSVMNWGPDLG